MPSVMVVKAHHFLSDRGIRVSATCPRLTCRSAPISSWTCDLFTASPTFYRSATSPHLRHTRSPHICELLLSPTPASAPAPPRSVYGWTQNCQRYESSRHCNCHLAVKERSQNDTTRIPFWCPAKPQNNPHSPCNVWRSWLKFALSNATFWLSKFVECECE